MPEIRDPSSIEESRRFTPRFDADGLIPCITVDASNGDVLMFAWMNAESLRKTLETGFVYYWSRSRQAIWKKGETSGSTQRVRITCTSCIFDAKSLADTIEASGRTWKTYAEGLPAPGFLGPFKGRYAKKHNPFAYFRSIAEDPARRARLVPLSRLAPDVRAGALPSFSLVVPDLCHSMHDCSVSVGDTWLRGQVGKFLKLPNTVVFVIFDEGSSNIRGGGHTAALALGTAVRLGSRSTALTGHYGILRTIERAWGLPLLGRSAHVAPITGIWR
jgi:phosphoribosyl-AMP cyclohydrolase